MSPSQGNYNERFYRDTTEASIQSAKQMLGLLFSLYKPKSVVDVGCGQGAWLSVAASLGSERLMGLDGAWVKAGSLLSDNIEFNAVDL
jgi:ribosomal protein L11 methylase PrmA